MSCRDPENVAWLVTSSEDVDSSVTVNVPPVVVARKALSGARGEVVRATTSPACEMGIRATTAPEQMVPLRSPR